MSLSPGSPASAISIKSDAESSESRNMSHEIAQQSARVRPSEILPRCDLRVAIERSSRRNFAYERSRSFIRSRSATLSPASSVTTVLSPATSSSTDFRRTTASPFTSYNPTARRCGRSSPEPAGTRGASCLIFIEVYLSPAISRTGRSVFTPAV